MRGRGAASAKKLTPARRQWEEAKAAHPDCLIMFRMGDFYETFGPDAKIAAETLHITLTKRAFSPDDDPFPMAGVPVHAFEGYAARLVRAGHRVAICEQLEDPKDALGPVVRRGVVRILSPGTLVEDRFLPGKGANYVASLLAGAAAGVRGSARTGYALGLLDISTGDFRVLEATDWQGVESALAANGPSEVLAPAELHDRLRLAAKNLDLLFALRPPPSMDDEEAETLIRRQFKIASSQSLGLARPELRTAAATLLRYCRDSLMSDVEHVRDLRVVGPADRLVMDSTALRNLEVFRSIRDGSEEGTLLRTLDSCATAMGSRLMSGWLREPLGDPAEINARLDAVQALVHHPSARLEVRDALAGCRDLDRALARLGVLNATPRDLLLMKDALLRAPPVQNALRQLADRGATLDRIADDLGISAEPASLIARVLDPVQEERVVREACDPEVDELRSLMRDSRDWIVKREEEERKRTGIKSLKISYNRVFGYFIEVTKPNIDKVPSHYIRKQTTAGGERYVTPELKETEERIATAQEKLESRERAIFEKLRAELRARLPELVRLSAAMAAADVIASFARTAAEHGYCRPEVDAKDRIHIRAGRHPVVERLTPGFVPNDCRLDGAEERLVILTGPNMAGKSTYMRQVALITMMAQAGSFVPADRAEIGVVDRVFTRVGANDDLVRGQSTFMVEMVELASILRSATPRSLVILDEIGRGTSTYDGLSIAWAVAECVHDRRRCGAKSILATHYHQLTQVTETLKAAHNHHMAVKESGEEVVFLHKVVPGPTDRSYGIHVARLAGLPESVVQRALEVLRRAEAQDSLELAGAGGDEKKRTRVHTQLMFLPTSAKDEVRREDLTWLKDALLALDPHNMTPMEALSALEALRKRLRGEQGTAETTAPASRTE